MYKNARRQLIKRKEHLLINTCMISVSAVRYHGNILDWHLNTHLRAPPVYLNTSAKEIYRYFYTYEPSHFFTLPHFSWFCIYTRHFVFLWQQDFFFDSFTPKLAEWKKKDEWSCALFCILFTIIYNSLQMCDNWLSTIV